MAIGQGYRYHGSSGPAKIRDGHLWAWNGSGHAVKLYAVKAAWAYLPGHGWRQWYPHGSSGSHPPSGGTVHTATAACVVTRSRISWRISSSRHVKTQRITVTSSRSSGWHGTIGGVSVAIGAGKSKTITISSSARSVSVHMTTGTAIVRATVRYTYS